MEATVKLPIGIEDFAEIRTEGFYYHGEAMCMKCIWYHVARHDTCPNGHRSPTAKPCA